MNGDESKAPELRDQLAEVERFNAQLNTVRSMDLQTLPAAFLKLYDEAPLIDRAKAAELRAAAEIFMPVLVHVRDELSLPDPQRWFAAINELMERSTRPH